MGFAMFLDFSPYLQILFRSKIVQIIQRRAFAGNVRKGYCQQDDQSQNRNKNDLEPMRYHHYVPSSPEILEIMP